MIYFSFLQWFIIFVTFLLYFPVTDKANRKTNNLTQTEVKNLLGISLHGISEFSANNKYQPLQEFSWDELESLYHKDFKFTIETENNDGEKKQCVWYGPTQIISAVWNMAIHQHRFYMERYPKDQDNLVSVYFFGQISIYLSFVN